MPDNLTIQIGADSSRARGEFRLLTAELKNLDRQINAAVKAGDVARAKELTSTYGVMKDRAVALDRSLKQLGASGSQALNEIRRSADGATASLAGTGRGARRLLSELSSLRGIGTLLGGGLGGGLAGGAVGAGVGIALEKLISQFEELAKSMRQIRDLARETGSKPLVVQGTQELAKEAGESAETANKFLTGMGATLAQVATKTRDLQTGIAVGGKAAEEAGRNFAVFGDKVVSIGRGGVPVIRDFSDALAILQINEERLVKLPLEQQQKLLAEAFLQTEKNAKQLGLTEIQLNEISKQVFQVPAETAGIMAKAFLERQAKIEELAKSERGATREHLNNVDEVAKAYEKLSQQVTETFSTMANASAGMRAAVISDLAAIINAARTNFMSKGPLATFTEDLAKNIRNFYDRMAADAKIAAAGGAIVPIPPDTSEKIQKEFSDLPGFFGGLTTTIGGIWGRFWSEFGKSAAQAGNEVINVFSLTSQAAAQTAAGVNVFRGSGTGDTGGYGPGSFPTQSILPGVSNYQAAPFKMVSPTGGFAAGGMVRGPGTGTSDSILARLSAGEFVMRAAAVNRLGAGFLSRLNGFADGGMAMPSRSIPRFADGGMVTAGGRPVHLHLGGKSFALAGSEGVVGALVSEAHSQQLRSAGVKPSWFAGRPSGR